jgi:hypothetical protein
MAMEIIPSPDQGVTDWDNDTDAIVAALRGCQEGLGGMFPNGTAGLYVGRADQSAYSLRRKRLNRIAAELKSGVLRLDQTNDHTDKDTP